MSHKDQYSRIGSLYWTLRPELVWCRYDYVVHGRAFRIMNVEVEGQKKGEIYVLYGGLFDVIEDW